MLPPKLAHGFVFECHSCVRYKNNNSNLIIQLIKIHKMKNIDVANVLTLLHYDL